jgi:hypothetical protein
MECAVARDTSAILKLTLLVTDTIKTTQTLTACYKCWLVRHID